MTNKAMEWLLFEKTREEKVMVINIPSSEDLDCSRPIIGTITDITTGKVFEFDWLETVPFYSGERVNVPGYDCPVRVYGNDDACLMAVRHTVDGEIIGLHPSRVSDSDQAKLTTIYRRDFAQGVYN